MILQKLKGKLSNILTLFNNVNTYGVWNLLRGPVPSSTVTLNPRTRFTCVESRVRQLHAVNLEQEIPLSQPPHIHRIGCVGQHAVTSQTGQNTCAVHQPRYLQIHRGFSRNWAGEEQRLSGGQCAVVLNLDAEGARWWFQEKQKQKICKS